MSNENEVRTGTVAIVKVGRNEVPVSVIERIASGYRVQSRETGRNFMVRQLSRIVLPAPSEFPGEPTLESRNNIPTASTPETEAANPAVKPTVKSKKLSLLEAAIEVLKHGREPMNARELVKAAAESGLWTPTDCKTPEQTLYGSIFREIATKEFPRIRKSAQKGKFEFGE